VLVRIDDVIAAMGLRRPDDIIDELAQFWSIATDHRIELVRSRSS